MDVYCGGRIDFASSQIVVRSIVKVPFVAPKIEISSQEWPFAVEPRGGNKSRHQEGSLELWMSVVEDVFMLL